MPRVSFDYRQLRAKVVEEGKKEQDVARAANMNPATLSLKFNNKSPFTQDEMISICQYLNVDTTLIPAYFFTVLV